MVSMANCYFANPHGTQHCYIPFLYVIDFKGAVNFGEAQVHASKSNGPDGRPHITNGTHGT
jgi:hypothetical protein